MSMKPEEMAEEMGITIEEVEERKTWANENCICPECPTYVEGDDDIAYCFPTVGKSEVIEKELSCICGKCPVYDEFDLNKGFYCTRGTEQEQAG